MTSMTSSYYTLGKRMLVVLGSLVILTILSGDSVLGAAATATLKAVPTSTTATVGNTLTVDIKLTTGNQAVSYVVNKISYSSNLQYVSYSGSGSVFDAEGIVNVSGNPLSLERYRADGGFNGADGQVVRLTFKALSAGSGTITINQPGSEVLAFSDGSNILQSIQNTSIAISAPPPASPTPSPTVSSTPNPTVSSTPSPTPSSTASVAASAAPSAKVTSSGRPSAQPSSTSSILPSSIPTATPSSTAVSKDIATVTASPSPVQESSLTRNSNKVSLIVMGGMAVLLVVIAGAWRSLRKERTVTTPDSSPPPKV